MNQREKMLVENAHGREIVIDVLFPKIKAIELFASSETHSEILLK